jgi:hypothetical protein
VGDITLSSKDQNNISVTGWTDSIALENITKQQVLADLSETKIIFDNMVKCSNEFEHFIKDKQIIYQISYDYGMGAVGICSETNKHLVWHTELKK